MFVFAGLYGWFVFSCVLIWLIDMVMRFWWWCLRCVGWLFVWCSCLLSFVVLCDVWVLVIVIGGCCLIVIWWVWVGG